MKLFLENSYVLSKLKNYIYKKSSNNKILSSIVNKAWYTAILLITSGK